MVISTTRFSDDEIHSNNAPAKRSNAASERLNSRKTSPADDVIVLLSDAYENQRARQVFEWERARRASAAAGR